MPNMLTETAEEWLAHQFEYEYCEECGGDTQHHNVIGVMWNWFALCLFPPSQATDWERHPVIKDYRAAQEAA